VLGLTGGYQTAECPTGGGECRGHALLGARARFNLVTAGPTIATLIGDYSASTTLGTEFGFGYAFGANASEVACVVDVGVPVSVAMLQTVRVVAFVAPGVAWDFGCTPGSEPSGASFVSGLGVGVQQLWLRGLDVSLGLQQILRRGAGLQFGVTISYIRLP
jgi:hypothetical protein